MHIAVIGAGINGISVAVNLLETLPGVKVTIFTHNVTPNTTGDVAAGLFRPYLVAEGDHRIKKWCRSTYNFLENFIATNPKHHKYGCCYLEVFELDTEPLEKTLFNEIVGNSRFLNEFELKRYPTAKYGLASTSIISEGKKILPYFYEKFKMLGGKIKVMQVKNFDEVQMIHNFPIVINCSGLGSRSLCNDMDIYPVRGQIIRIHAPWIKYSFNKAEHYIIPQSDGVVVLGGTTQENNWNTLPDENDTKNILNGCKTILNGLEECNILSVNVGLRPGRKSVRLEKENRTNFTTGNKYTIIHNYGHGGSGFTLFWGCAKDVGQLVSDILLKAKL
uniref:D-amino acid oxidase n=1 Tax=Dugesia ryukyuensis TaxID=79738 RepID=OXDA_DUGRY|nr:D-amino acid oxidase [Dugesia ryukyuensis]